MASPKSSPLPLPPPPSSKSSSAAAIATTNLTDLQLPSHRPGPSRSSRLLHRVRSVFRSIPIIAPTNCKFPSSLPGGGGGPVEGHVYGGTRMTGTLFGRRRGRVSLAIQENSRCAPMFVLELAVPTGKLLQDMGAGLVRVALECEKQAGGGERRRRRRQRQQQQRRLVEEPVWTMYCNGRKAGYAARREATAEDLGLMKLLHAVSVGAGVLPTAATQEEAAEGEMTYLRAYFERVVGSRDSETYYMMNPDGNGGSELSIFFVRI